MSEKRGNCFKICRP